MKKYKIKIEGVTPYMQHRMDDIKLEEWEKSRGLIIERSDVAKEDQVRAEFHCYRDMKTKKCFIPSEHLRGAMITAGTYVKGKVGAQTKSMKSTVAAMFSINEEKIFIPDYDEIDKRSAVNRNVKARVISVRPKWTKWEIEFILNVDNDTLTNETVQQIIEYSGNYVGIGSFRPTNNGMFGRFKIKEAYSLSKPFQ